MGTTGRMLELWLTTEEPIFQERKKRTWASRAGSALKYYLTI
jgi:hypothetical protein